MLEKGALADKCSFFNILKGFFRQTERRLLICRELTTGDQMVVKPDLSACQQSTLLCAVSITLNWRLFSGSQIISSNLLLPLKDVDLLLLPVFALISNL